MANCTNCRKKLGCSCKKRAASDGKSCCVTCVGAYEATLKKSKTTTSSASAPTNVTATARYN